VKELKFLSALEEKYRRAIITMDPSVEKYVRTSRDFRLALTTTLTSILLITLFHVLYIEDPITFILAISPALVMWFRILDVFTSMSNLRRRLEQELPFIMVAAASISRTGLELADLLKQLANSKAFKASRVLGERFTALAEFFGHNKALQMLSRMASSKARLLLSEYSASLSTGTALHFIRDRAMDAVKTAFVEADRALQLRSTIATVMVVFYGLMPSLALGLAMLQFTSLNEVDTALSPQTYSIAIALISTLPLTLTLIPDYPLAMLVTIDRGVDRMLSLLFTTGSIALAIPTVCLLNNGLGGFREAVLYCSVVAAMLGLPGFIHPLLAVLSSRVDIVVEEMLNHIRVWHSLHLFKSSRLERELKKRVKPWAIDYVSEVLQFFKSVGDCDPGAFETFAVFIQECRRSMMRYALSLITVVIVSAVGPVITAMVLKTSIVLLTEHIVAGYAASLAYGYVANKLATGKNKSTLLPAASALFYTMLLL